MVELNHLVLGAWNSTCLQATAEGTWGARGGSRTEEKGKINVVSTCKHVVCC